MLAEGLEKDFSRWEMRVGLECKIIITLLDDEESVRNEEIFQKLKELPELYISNAPAFIEHLKDINRAVFIQKITSKEDIESKDLDSIVDELKSKRRIPSRYLETLDYLMNLNSQTFANIKLPSQKEILLFKAMGRSEKRDALKVELDALHEKYEKLTVTLISFANIVAWYYRTYEETPDIGFTWDFDLDGGQRKRELSKKIPIVQEFKGVLDSKYDILRAPARYFTKFVEVEKYRDVEKIIEHTYQIPKEIIVEKTKYEGKPFIQPVEIIKEKVIENPTGPQQREIIQVVKKVEVEKIVERKVPKPVIKKVEVEKEVIKKRSPLLVIILIIVFTLIGIAGGYFIGSSSEAKPDENTDKIAEPEDEIDDSKDTEDEVNTENPDESEVENNSENDSVN